MQVNEAVRAAKAYIAEVFAEEKIVEIGLEEVRIDDGIWDITIGFRRPWPKRVRAETDRGLELLKPKYKFQDRWFKLVRIRDDDGVVLGVYDGELHAA